MKKVRTIFWIIKNILVFNIDINHCGNYLYMFITNKNRITKKCLTF